MDKELEFSIRKRYNELRSSEKKVADVILGGNYEAEGLTIIRLASLAGVSQPTVLRFASAMGFDGFKGLKLRILQGMAGRDEKITRPMYGYSLCASDKLEDIPAKTTYTTIQILQETLKSISVREYEKAVKALAFAGSIVVYGVENSSCVVSDLVTKLLYLGLDCHSYQDYYLQSISANNLGEGDVAVGISYSGCSRDTVDVMRQAKKSGATTIVITNFENALISRYGDIIICASSRQFLYGEAIFSRTSQTAIVDMLYTGLLTSNYEKYTKKMDESSHVIRGRAYKEL